MAQYTIITNTIRRPVELVWRSVRASLAQGDEVGVVLVDQNNPILAIPQDVRDDPRLQHQPIPVPGVSAARNRASYSSSTQWLIFCDDDGYLDQHYLSCLKQVISSHPGVRIFAGSIRRTDNGEFYSKRHAIGGDLNRFWNTKLLMGSNFVIHRETFERLQKFDERFGAGGEFGSSEETDLAWNAYFQGVPMKFCPELVVHHVPPFAGSAADEKKKARRYGVGKGRLVRKWLSPSRPVVLVELLEMLCLPPLQAVFSILTFEPTQASIRLAGWIGRLRGLS